MHGEILMTNLAPQRDLFTRRWRTQLQPQKEATFHIQLVSMLRWCVRPDVLWRHVPNGEHRDARTAAKLKAMGVLPGSADLEFFYSSALGRADPSGQDRDEFQASIAKAGPHILFLELKLPGRKQSEAQAGFALAMKLLGAEYQVARSVDEAIAILGERGLIRRDVEVCGRRW
jgi:hypothetical protein